MFPGVGRPRGSAGGDRARHSRLLPMPQRPELCGEEGVCSAPKLTMVLPNCVVRFKNLQGSVIVFGEYLSSKSAGYLLQRMGLDQNISRTATHMPNQIIIDNANGRSMEAPPNLTLGDGPLPPQLSQRPLSFIAWGRRCRQRKQCVHHARGVRKISTL
jgi:hypothetical protein